MLAKRRSFKATSAKETRTKYGDKPNCFLYFSPYLLRQAFTLRNSDLEFLQNVGRSDCLLLSLQKAAQTIPPLQRSNQGPASCH